MAKNKQRKVFDYLSRKKVRAIQKELLRVYEEKKRTVTQYSYGLMAEEIEDFWRQEMPEDIRAALPDVYRELSSPGLYVEGKKNDNFRKFVTGDARSMRTERIIACLIWLSWDQNEYCNWTIEDMDSSAKVTQSKMIGILDAYLFQHADHQPYIDPNCFFTQYQETSNSNWICFGEFINEHTVEVQYYETHADSLHVYCGHILIGPDDTGYGFFNSATCGDTKMFGFIPLGREVLNGKRIERFSLVEIGSSACAFEEEPKLTVSMYTVSEVR